MDPTIQYDEYDENLQYPILAFLPLVTFLFGLYCFYYFARV